MGRQPDIASRILATIFTSAWRRRRSRQRGRTRETMAIEIGLGRSASSLCKRKEVGRDMGGDRRSENDAHDVIYVGL
eukprot:scaffold2383_cov161-Amphora_coffeaeformis.AAC.30